MRLYAPLYEGDGIIRHRAAFGEPALELVRGNNEAEVETDPRALEQQARAARSAWIASKLRAMYQAVADWLERSDNFERDNFLAGAANLAELEQRQRHFERTGRAHF